MRLLIEEHLSLLREDGELEVLVSDLVTSMGLNILFGPQKGVRQNGVDIHAVGVDPDDGKKKNFLFAIKRGDVDRAAWGTGNQSVRSTVQEILDVYIPALGPNEKRLPKKVILCCGGEIKQEAAANWTGFQRTNRRAGVKYETWNGNGLSSLIEKYLLNENIFFEGVRRGMRRTLVVLSDPDYDLRHFKNLIGDLLFGEKWTSLSKGTIQRRSSKAFKALSVCLGMIFHYSKESGNLKHPFLAAEYTILRCWDFILKHGLEENSEVTSNYVRLFQIYDQFCREYFLKIQAHCYVRDGIVQSCRHSVTASKVTFEQIGIVSSIGLNQAFRGLASKDPENFENAKVVSDALSSLLKNNGVSGSPIFDGMTVDICLGIFFLALTNKTEDIRTWISDLVHRFNYSYTMYEKHFPIGDDSLEALIEFEEDEEKTKEEMVSVSTLLPTLAYWCAILNFEEEYDRLVKFVSSELKNSCLQIWYPGAGIKKIFYSGYAGHENGVAEAPIYLPESLTELRARLRLLLKETEANPNFEFKWNDSPPALPLIASRSLRTPVVPFLWLLLLPADDAPTGEPLAVETGK